MAASPYVVVSASAATSLYFLSSSPEDSKPRHCAQSQPRPATLLSSSRLLLCTRLECTALSHRFLKRSTPARSSKSGPASGRWQDCPRVSQAPDLQVSPSREKEERAGPEPKERLISCPQALPRSALNPHNPPTEGGSFPCLRG